ncbi:MAG: hypothetical protein RML93_10455 [Anaerolineales bacterium]|nr:hypothetical protein [Anaerolineales bacterium]MCS7248864.1 hypothetical protein [Anaerolineales bacterium]MDW8162677.1 hypothetical protein [Anaerolineales bacterium]MDW8447697.1 hypothetical protein [Anaerolineales bacterium]
MVYLSLVQEGPAETTVYMIAGYALILVVMAIYLATLWMRWRNLQRDQETLETLLPREQDRPNSPDQ